MCRYRLVTTMVVISLVAAGQEPSVFVTAHMLDGTIRSGLYLGGTARTIRIQRGTEVLEINIEQITSIAFDPQSSFERTSQAIQPPSSPQQKKQSFGDRVKMLAGRAVTAPRDHSSSQPSPDHEQPGKQRQPDNSQLPIQEHQPDMRIGPSAPERPFSSKDTCLPPLRPINFRVQPQALPERTEYISMIEPPPLQPDLDLDFNSLPKTQRLHISFPRLQERTGIVTKDRDGRIVKTRRLPELDSMSGSGEYDLWLENGRIRDEGCGSGIHQPIRNVLSNWGSGPAYECKDCYFIGRLFESESANRVIVILVEPAEDKKYMIMSVTLNSGMGYFHAEQDLCGLRNGHVVKLKRRTDEEKLALFPERKANVWSVVCSDGGNEVKFPW